MESKNIKWYIAQLNIGRILGATMDDAIMKEFVDQQADINLLAEKSEGFVWRYKEKDDKNALLNPFGDERIIINMSVWESIEHLEAFAYKGRHLEVLKKKGSWFERMDKPVVVLWYVSSSHFPTMQEAKDRLFHLQNNGPSPYAFDFRNKVEKPGA